jgi:hypothetical protein
MTTPVPAPTPTDAVGEPASLGSFNGFEIYPMPMFATVAVADVAAVSAWYQAALGFLVVFATPGPTGTPVLVHLRRRKYQDLLLVPAVAAGPPAAPSSLTVTFQADGEVAALADRARAVGALGESSLVGPVDTPWNTTDLRVTDPAGHRLIFTSRRAVPDPALAAQWAERMDAARRPSS